MVIPFTRDLSWVSQGPLKPITPWDSKNLFVPQIKQGLTSHPSLSGDTDPRPTIIYPTNM
jgi:hypothetical protein